MALSCSKKVIWIIRGITSKHVGDFYCLNCFIVHSFRIENKLKKHYNECKKYDNCCAEMPKEDNKISKHNPGEKSIKAPFVIYADFTWKNDQLSKWFWKIIIN